MRGPKRRDIGHGALAERALVPMIPSQEEFPYTIRVVSRHPRVERLVLDGLGVRLDAVADGRRRADQAPVAGIAMGLIKEGDDYVILTDIAGVEDHLGDMDFKVAGTEAGITALQMDIKITGVTFEILRDALTQAQVARQFILGEMSKVIDAPRAELSKHAPRISTIQIDPEKIGLLIGKGGETIRGLQEEFEAQIDVDDDGQVLVYAANGERGDALVDRIRSMTKEVEVGDEFTGKVVKTTDVRRVHRALEGHRRPAAHLQRRPGQADRLGRGGPQQGRRAERQGGRGRPRARPDRPPPRRRSRDRRQERRGARRRRQRRPGSAVARQPAIAAAGTAAADAGTATVTVIATATAIAARHATEAGGSATAIRSVPLVADRRGRRSTG